MNITKCIYLSSVGSHFKDNEGILIIMRITATYPLRDLHVNTSTLVALFKSVDLFYAKNMSDY